METLKRLRVVLISSRNAVSDKNKVLAGSLLILLMASFVLDMLLFAQQLRNITRSGPTVQLGDTPLLWAELSLTAFGDMALALALVFLLYRGRFQVSFTRTASMIDRIMMYTIGTGLLTATFNLAGLVTALTMRKNLVFLVILEMLPKSESNSSSIHVPN